MKVYVVTAYRFGDQEKHSYVVGVYSRRKYAELAARVEKCWRGGKYECHILEESISRKPDIEKLKCYLETL